MRGSTHKLVALKGENMKKYTELELRDILEKHSLWLERDPNGVRADLRWADLSGANLNGANLSEASLRGADLRGADLSQANLRKADIHGADLGGADLSVADLRGANLGWADLYGADLRVANLSGADLYRAGLYGADLSAANLSAANLNESDLRWADLSGADISGANLYGAGLYESKGVNYPMNCPEKGSFIGFKKVRDNLIIELEITEDALRSSATGRKCRCSKAKVLSITNIDGTNSNTNYAVSLRDPDFVYTAGETIEVPNFDTNRWNECAPGIHFFITRQEAVDFKI